MKPVAYAQSELDVVGILFFVFIGNSVRCDKGGTGMLCVAKEWQQHKEQEKELYSVFHKRRPVGYVKII